MPDTVLILGAAGRLGRCLALAFSEAGWHVLAQARKPLPLEVRGLPNVQVLISDAMDVPGLVRAAQGAQVVVNAVNPEYTQWVRLAEPLADAAQETALRLGALLMLPGNVYNFGNQLPSMLRTDTPEQGNTPKARIRINIEARMAAAAAQGLNSVVLRAGDFFGGTGTGLWFDMVLTSRLSKGVFVYPGGFDQLHAWAYLPDLARCFVRVASQRARLNGHHRLHFAGDAITGAQLHEALQQAGGQSLKRNGLPWWLMRLASPLVPMWRETLVMRYLWERAHQLDDTSLRALIGSPPRTDLVNALRASLQALKPDLRPS